MARLFCVQTTVKTALAGSCLLGAFFVSGNAFAQDVSLSLPCQEGGEVSIQGSWNFLSGALDLTMTPNNCMLRNGIALSGSGTITGTFSVSLTNTTLAAMDTVTDVQVTMTRGEEIITGEANKKIIGTYDLTAGKLDGQVISSSTFSGNMAIPVEQLITVDWSNLLAVQ
ncbi:MAG: hypothetical protein GY862_13680 [Gammaproteobacteria bacterium]|nr:hypothetical protein [Gammaproteobacteria bacterium]